MSLFRYSGNKSKLLHYYKVRTPHPDRVVELYLGSGAYSLQSTRPAIGFDTNPAIISMWKWLQSSTPYELKELNEFVEHEKTKETKPNVKSMGLELGPETYVRVNVCGLVVGQLSSWRIYPQHKLPIESTINHLNRIKQIQVYNRQATDYNHTDGDLLFLDPPYIGTKANYTGHEQYNPQDTIDIINKTDNPIIFTYGTNAPDIFPDYEWHVITKKKVPNMRRGGTVERIEYVTYINWNNK